MTLRLRTRYFCWHFIPIADCCKLKLWIIFFIQICVLISKPLILVKSFSASLRKPFYTLHFLTNISMLDSVPNNSHQKLWFAFPVCLMLSTQEKKARCHCDQLNKHKFSACPHPPSLVLLPFPFTQGLCAVTWLWAMLKLRGRGWDFNERNGLVFILQ